MPFEPAPKEPISEIAKKQFQQFRRLRELVLATRASEGRRRAELTNRFRRGVQFRENDRVMWRDPKLAKTVAGRAPWKRPLYGPGRVTDVRCNRIDVRRESDGVIVRSLHAENIVMMPSTVDDLEVIAAPPAAASSSSGSAAPPTPSEEPCAELSFEPGDPSGDTLERRSPGQMP